MASFTCENNISWKSLKTLYPKLKGLTSIPRLSGRKKKICRRASVSVNVTNVSTHTEKYDIKKHIHYLLRIPQFTSVRDICQFNAYLHLLPSDITRHLLHGFFIRFLTVIDDLYTLFNNGLKTFTADTIVLSYIVVSGVFPSQRCTAIYLTGQFMHILAMAIKVNTRVTKTQFIFVVVYTLYEL